MAAVNARAGGSGSKMGLMIELTDPACLRCSAGFVSFWSGKSALPVVA